MPDNNEPVTQAFNSHNHDDCQQKLLKAAEMLCEQNNVRLTPRRIQVLKILLGSHQPMGAYDVLQALNKTEQGVTPPIVYRALEFLLEQGLVHRIESSNAFIACDHPGHHCASQFLICSKCHRVAELDSDALPLAKDAEKLGFEAQQAVVEIKGLCADCK